MSIISFQNVVLIVLLVFTVDRFIVSVRAGDVARYIFYGLAALLLLLALIVGNGLIH